MQSNLKLRQTEFNLQINFSLKTVSELMYAEKFEKVRLLLTEDHFLNQKFICIIVEK